MWPQWAIKSLRWNINGNSRKKSSTAFYLFGVFELRTKNESFMYGIFCAAFLKIHFQCLLFNYALLSFINIFRTWPLTSLGQKVNIIFQLAKKWGNIFLSQWDDQEIFIHFTLYKIISQFTRSEMFSSFFLIR